MNNIDRQRVRQIFIEVTEAPPEEREAALQRACGDDTALRTEVEALLAAEAGAGAFMRHPTASPSGALHASTITTPLTEGPGTKIGRYKLLQLIGEGGFGVVFMADEEGEVRRRVALKIIKLGMDTRSVVARFEQERQALALMNHPNIAKILGAGATESGRPYFVMEYVTGDPIIHFADAHKLSVKARLDLFMQVCQAVQHAHTKGIIHRDIKPSNILVNMTDGKPFAKVIDFGIAKATGARLTDKTLFTEHRQLIGTPEYMSPEQAEGSADIDTRTDVYGLGVLLYELLTGLTPFDAKRLRSAAFAEMQRIIKEEDPPSPSLRVSRNLPTLAATAAARQIEPAKLGTLMKGELDWIVMKALDKDRARRYETPSALAADVQRHLQGEPVVAAPPSAAYRVRKFVRKHRGPVMAGSAVVAALVLGIVGTTWGLIAADREKERRTVQAELATEAIQFIATKLFPDMDRIEVSATGVAMHYKDGTISYTDVAEWNDPRSALDPKGYLTVVWLQDLAATGIQKLRNAEELALARSGELEATNEKLRDQAQRAKAGVGKMMGILVGRPDMGPMDSIRESDGVSEFDDDPLGAAVGVGIQFAEELKETNDELRTANKALQQQNATAMETLARIVSSDMASPTGVGFSYRIEDRDFTITPCYPPGSKQMAFLKTRLVDGAMCEPTLVPDSEVIPLFAILAERAATASINARQELESANATLREEVKRAELAEADLRYETLLDWEARSADEYQGAIDDWRSIVATREKHRGPEHIDTVKALWQLSEEMERENRARRQTIHESDEVKEDTAGRLERASSHPDGELLDRYVFFAWNLLLDDLDIDATERWLFRIKSALRHVFETEGWEALRTWDLICTISANDNSTKRELMTIDDIAALERSLEQATGSKLLEIAAAHWTVGDPTHHTYDPLMWEQINALALEYLQANADDVHALTAIAGAQRLLNHPEEAIQAATSAQQLREQTGLAPNSNNQAVVAMSHHALGHSDQAKAELTRLREMMTNDSRQLVFRADSFLKYAERLIDPRPTAEQQLAEESKQRRLAEAAAVIAQSAAREEQAPGMQERVQQAVLDRTEILGRIHPLTMEARLELFSKYSSDEHDRRRAFAEDRFRKGACASALSWLENRAEHPVDWAILAMSHHKLGHAEEARAAFAKLQDLMTKPEFADDADCQALYAEARELIEGVTSEQSAEPEP